jgi:hypothetical protein
MRRVKGYCIAVTTLALGAGLVGVAVRAGAQEENRANKPPAPYVLNMGDLMNTVIQPRHAKLGLAGRAENWPLAGYLLRQLQQSFDKTADAIPRWKGLPVGDLFDAAVKQPIAALDFSIKAGEPRSFAENYEKLTTGCNNCHATTEQQFVVITVPKDITTPFPNQVFEPKR